MSVEDKNTNSDRSSSSSDKNIDESNGFKSFFQSSSGEDDPIRFLGFTVVAVVFIWLLSGLFIVSPSEQSVILRFGQYSSTVGPGIHWIPRFIDAHYTENVTQVRNFSLQSEMLTTDENIVSVQLAVHYRIDNIKQYLFNVKNPVRSLKEATSSALRQVVGTMSLNSVLTTGREKLSDEVNAQLKQTLQGYHLGLVVSDIALQPVRPPKEVREAFDDVIKAREDKQRYINKARAYSRRQLSIVKGQVQRKLNLANAYKQKVVLDAQGQTARYFAVLKPYIDAPRVTHERLYLDAMSSVLSKTSNIVVESKGNNVIYLPINQLLKRNIKVNQSLIEHTNKPKPSPKKVHQQTHDTTNSISYGEPRPSHANSGGVSHE